MPHRGGQGALLALLLLLPAAAAQLGLNEELDPRLASNTARDSGYVLPKERPCHARRPSGLLYSRLPVCTMRASCRCLAENTFTDGVAVNQLTGFRMTVNKCACAASGCQVVSRGVISIANVLFSPFSLTVSAMVTSLAWVERAPAAPWSPLVSRLDWQSAGSQMVCQRFLASRVSYRRGTRRGAEMLNKLKSSTFTGFLHWFAKVGGGGVGGAGLPLPDGVADSSQARLTYLVQFTSGAIFLSKYRHSLPGLSP
ncbi:hypothetical protein E2C01_024740 [Portunus trituberculatus]|uniref:Uncharacterized protein n=1 Tax=Portunus trituberculatus TaxID=210409 RepID=A0A5B7EBK6_PORTR|nr:hypothetical protein [Portunus trituberculatus]